MFTHINIVEGIEEGSIDLLGVNEDSKEGSDEGSKEGSVDTGFKDIYLDACESLMKLEL